MPKGHYAHHRRRTRTPGKEVLYSPRGATLAERFEQKVDRSTGPDGCHVWIGARKDCYPWWHGEIWNGKRPEGAHRVALRLAGIEIPKGMHVDHICRNGLCVNVKHLRVVTPKQNALENNGSPLAINAGKTHCVHGHAFTPDNTRYYTPKYALDPRGLKKPGRPTRLCITCYESRTERAKLRAQSLSK